MMGQAPMFHVKPSGKERDSPTAIAREVRSLVADYLRSIGCAPFDALFLDRIEKLAGLIALWGARINLTAAPSDPGELAFHIIDSLMPLVLAERQESHLKQAFKSGIRVLDLGSGGGFPGLVLSSASPAHFTLLESRRKRAAFLSVAAAEIGLENVEIDCRRIKPSELEPLFDVVTARAFASPPVFHSIAASALRPAALAILYANAGQDVDPSGAKENGLCDFQRLTYSIPRSGRLVQRVLALWRRG